MTLEAARAGCLLGVGSATLIFVQESKCCSTRLACTPLCSTITGRNSIIGAGNRSASSRLRYFRHNHATTAHAVRTCSAFGRKDECYSNLFEYIARNLHTVYRYPQSGSGASFCRLLQDLQMPKKGQAEAETVNLASLDSKAARREHIPGVGRSPICFCDF